MTNTRYRNVYLDNHTHFCTASIVSFLPLLMDETVCRMILGVWKRQSARYQVRLEGFVIMPDHIHLLVNGLGENVRKFMQYSLAEISRHIGMMLKTKAIRGDGTAEQRVQALRDHANGSADLKIWKERFRAFPLNLEEPLRVKLEYIHANPVRRRLVSEPSEWRWSSYGYYEGEDALAVVDCAFEL